jgi:hypothetical protein
MARMVAAVLGMGKAVSLAAGPAMARIVTYAYRYKRPSRRKKGLPLEVPTMVRAADPEARKRVMTVRQSDGAPAERPVADERKPVETSTQRASKSAIVTARNPAKQYAFVPDLTEEELQWRRDTADAMMQAFKRQIAAKLRRGGD